MGRRTHPGIVAVVCLFAGVAVAAEKAAKKEKPKLAVVDFKIVGDVGLKDAGPFIAELLLAHFDTKAYELLKRAQLVKILAAHNLKMADIATNPALAAGKKLKGVRYLVVGSVVKGVDLRISARVVDVTTGHAGRQVEVSASATDARDLDDKLKQLSAILSSKGSAPTPPRHVPPTRRKALRLDLGKGVTMKLVLIPAGRFRMGSLKTETGRRDDEDFRWVVISKPFYMAVTEVTQSQWEAVMRYRLWSGEKYTKNAAENAASYVSWAWATRFCTKLSQKAARTVRLPTEAEWEYACRAGRKTKYCFGDDESKLGDYAWYEKNAEDAWPKAAYAHPVGRKKANAWGLYDMHGNVAEWCGDWYGEKYYSYSKRLPTRRNTLDPTGPASGSRSGSRSGRVCRGGSWRSSPKGCRAAARGAGYAGEPVKGFRVVSPGLAPKGTK